MSSPPETLPILEDFPVPFVTQEGARYRRNLPHYRIPGGTYHIRFSISGRDRILTHEWMYSTIEEELIRLHKHGYLLFAYVIMSTHTRAVCQPLPKSKRPLEWGDYRNYFCLETLVGQIKGRTARVINQKAGRSGSLWLGESFDRIIHGDKELADVIDYIHHNPVRWRLVDRPEDYRWSSINTIYSEKEEYRGWFDWI